MYYPPSIVRKISSGRTDGYSEELAVWLFYFHQEHVGCDNESPIYPIKTMVGCTRKASTPVENGSDGLLLLLNDEIPDDYNVFFNGWDRSICFHSRA